VPNAHQPLSQSEAAERLGGLQILTLILSVYVLIALLLQATIKLSAETTAILDAIDFFVCLVFLADFFVRFRRAPSKAQFLKWGWIDFVSSIPMLNLFRVGRVVRIVRVFRILRAFRSTKNLVLYFLHHRRLTSFAAVAAISLSVMVFSAIAVLNFEDSSESNIKSAADAFWWAFVTMTTVGYGDKYPVTDEGRIVACILMTAGAALFATLTGFIASMFVRPEAKAAEVDVQELAREVRSLAEKVEALTNLGRLPRPSVDQPETRSH
jgi:voltage-gated potassium channel